MSDATEQTRGGAESAHEPVPQAAPAPTPERVHWGAVAAYTALACGLAWLVVLPLWLKDPDEPGYSALAAVLVSAMMFTPALATVAVMLLFRVPARDRARALGLWPLRPARRVVWFLVGALVAPVLLVAAALAVSALFGWVELDLVHFSAFQATIDAQLASLGTDLAASAAASLPPTGVLVALQLLAIPIGAIANTLFTFGEELGWRGWLLPALRPLGVWPALILHGAIWGLWHTPVILLGHNFGLTDWRGVLVMTVGCVAWGTLFGWARLRSGSVWPAVLGHGALNASAGLFLMLAAEGAPLDPVLVNPLGVSGWIVLALAVGVLAALRQFGREPGLAPQKGRQDRSAPRAMTAVAGTTAVPPAAVPETPAAPETPTVGASEAPPAAVPETPKAPDSAPATSGETATPERTDRTDRD